MHWFGSFLEGGKAILLKGTNPETIIRTASEEHCTIVWLLVPWAQDILDALDRGDIKLEDYELDQWRLMHIGAQPVPPSLIKRWKAYFPHHQYDTNYGLSESIGPGCVHLGVENIHKVGAIGKAGYGWKTKIVDERRVEVAKGEVGELAVFGAAFVGALIGFLWYNCYPAQVFMGDTGSLAIGGIVAVFALAIRKELLLPILCGIYLVEVVSVMMQTFYFKYTRKKYGEGRRIFRMAPLHHHYQKKNMPENRIVVRFWIIQILLAALSLMTLKIR
jgi:hypothetical protein